MPYLADENRYEKMQYNYTGNSGLKLPAVSLGLWHNFGGVDTLENARKMLRKAFDLGITHFDLANNYGPPAGSAEETMGILMEKDFRPYRDQLVISSKAGYYMWPGPYGEWGSRKYLISSLDQSLKRMGLDYVDIFYHHRPDPDTPLEETIGALKQIQDQGKALYVGISNYNAEQTKKAVEVAENLGVKLLLNQYNYSIFDRWSEEDNLLETLSDTEMGSIIYSPLSQGLLTDKYLNGIPADSRAAKESGFLKKDSITEEKLDKIRELNSMASDRGQSLSQMALAWVLDQGVTSVLVGASKVDQIIENVGSLKNTEFSNDELAAIEAIVAN
ncbi:L-glyceraldehyde 3-phosphate reductase [Halanaerobium congolense]|jgi:L-glyceraldehyde 3-phosphate reductase|uniref:L-glyceraldehyde 3-phosphate reductase n=1 Tax=Halanaerobium congolense TaxID=54121 RepID=A0A1M7PKQ7_9FIRM|nr:L-glyceraldehyde 3-phosphate reductase [Halanaerobium congolense]PTX16294.1 L-glyceraldehyde 3-phosphate reductase [Halanaerobium congolense]SDG16077.1 L-glyceraldehyde 3-phosphate reductase [Halanaerobium congolense]SDH86055.1 L-glyceraldehyde 3-phosphate reductase [Halanaerobium congolense]SET25722.1 L-glyceraldehyde 3-phosphate reductase [Halanaerobium congolense]SFP75845.1 L-glyceraldehyde 3-phosphate reductase [Halanaerobium congolense]